ncbi:MAG: hypothetical protein WHU10_11975, partial [Fimbriimonadales bacterium]
MERPLTPLEPGSELRAWIEEYDADRNALDRRYPARWARRALERKRKLAELWLERVQSLEFGSLTREGKIDALLFENHLEGALAKNQADARLAQEAEGLLGFVETASALELERKDRQWIAGRDAAERIHRLKGDVEEATRRVEAGVDPVLAAVGADMLKNLRQILDDWHGFYDGYDPEFTWWMAEPWKRLVDAWDKLQAALAKAAGDTGDNPPIVGRRVGRDGLVEGLRREWMEDTPERLIEIGEREMAWCEARLREAAAELGYGNDWKSAIERVKETAVPPGRQPQMVAELAEEAERYLAEHDLLDVPALASEVWQMTMMSAEQQKIAPFFYGGETITVSYPTQSMDHAFKLMSQRGNNPHFS